ncbi:hypothetical protein CAEBREN_09746 [Caenorhabditis brenneri]|uniref:Uncharacterized protein n=1 Tax=Caenorhabditis brenneri TaxID=135651 RepID=G0NZJ0_CAEBE|nr:hypothetical protein CAEBREN_09746 [Caenorhabditis brenneri]
MESRIKTLDGNLDYARASKSELTDKEKLAHFLTLLKDYVRDKAEEVREKNEEATFEEIVAHMKAALIHGYVRPRPTN